MSQRTPTNPALIEAAARLAQLPIDPQRCAQLVPDMDGFFQLLDGLHTTDLGETPPAFAYRSQWDKP
jgi:hypothetical protein